VLNKKHTRFLTTEESAHSPQAFAIFRLSLMAYSSYGTLLNKGVLESFALIVGGLLWGLWEGGCRFPFYAYPHAMYGQFGVCSGRVSVARNV